jgi:tryptophan synthase alpha subunit
MSYLNPLLALDSRNSRRSANSGVCGFIVPDLPTTRATSAALEPRRRPDQM